MIAPNWLVIAVSGLLLCLGALAFAWCALWVALFVLDKIAKQLGILRAFFEFCLERNRKRRRDADRAGGAS